MTRPREQGPGSLCPHICLSVASWFPTLGVEQSGTGSKCLYVLSDHLPAPSLYPVPRGQEGLQDDPGLEMWVLP